MRPPADKRSDDKIIAEIIKRVECPPKVTPFIERMARRCISDLRTAPESFSGNRKENIDFAKRFRSQIVEIERTLKSASNNPFVLSVLFEERFWQLWWNEQNTPIAINANTKQHIARERLHRNHFNALLGRLREQCNKVIHRKPGEHGGTEHQQRGAAWASFIILQFIAEHAGEKLGLSVSPTSTFVEVGRLFHEAATGEPSADLTAACKAIKRYYELTLDAKI